jgi:two-component system, chemotaxis family, chemotaxis protein CheY
VVYASALMKNHGQPNRQVKVEANEQAGVFEPNNIMKKRKSARLAPAPKGTVFVVDDNALLVELASVILEAAGYAVKQFSDPKAVLRAMQKADPKPAILVTDYEMGEINGLDLILSSHKIHPTLKTILLSGTVDSSISLGHTARVHRFLGKPYEPAQLKKIVADLMQS